MGTHYRMKSIQNRDCTGRFQYRPFRYWVGSDTGIGTGSEGFGSDIGTSTGTWTMEAERDAEMGSLSDQITKKTAAVQRWGRTNEGTAIEQGLQMAHTSHKRGAQFLPSGTNLQ